jgi:hypothetical protein
MHQATCGHCGVAISDRSSVVQQGNKSYCCNNCALLAAGRTPAGAEPLCAHCQRPLLDRSTEVAREGQTYCCSNCANAMAPLAGERLGGAGNYAE